MADLDLDALLLRTAAGDKAAFAALYQATSSHLFAVLLRMLKRRDWAEDALQDCYVKVWQRAETYTPERGTALPWLLTVARYRALDRLRGLRPDERETDRHVDFEDETSTTPEIADEFMQSPEATAIEQEGLSQMSDCLKNLPNDQRRSLLLAYYQGYTHPELAEKMGAPLGTVKSWVRRGLSRLRDCLEAA
jgi:RNA polymerase sigma-70 factor (ECF subfamily)